jgi:hypothetical protein
MRYILSLYTQGKNAPHPVLEPDLGMLELLEDTSEKTESSETLS